MLSSHEVAGIMQPLTKVHSIDTVKVVCHCPMAQWEHKGGEDRSPSFAVMRGRTGWWVNCLACRYRKTLEGMIWDIMGRNKRPLKNALIMLYQGDDDTVQTAPIEEITYKPLGFYQAYNAPVFKRPDYAANAGHETDMFGASRKVDEPEERPDLSWLEKWERAAPPMEYVQERGITYDAYMEWRLGNDTYNRRLMFPVFNRDGSFVGYTGRLYHSGETCFTCGASIMEEHINGRTGEVQMKTAVNCSGCRRSYVKYKHFKGKWRRNVVYGLHRRVSGPIVVTEGTMDAIRLWTLGVRRPVCILGANLSPNQVIELRDACDQSLEYPIIFMGDNDDAGREMARDGVERMKSVGIRSFSLDCPASDPDTMTYQQARTVLPASAFN